ncbi:MAG TPA: alpha/beta fold hydrolase [Myxococcales bacterium]|jgi:3-oxoadipate enol-lactonase
MGFLQSNGARIHYLDKGEGPALLLLHAFPLSSSMWIKQANDLKDHYRVLAPDFPGFGKSELLPQPATIDLYAQVALALLDAAKVEKATVLGLSMGGYVAFELWSRAKDRVAALALCDTKATPDSADARKSREATAHAVEDDGIGVLAERMIPNLVSPAAPDALKRDIEKMITENSADGAAAALRAMAQRKDFTGSLKDIACPTLVVVGDHDTVTPAAEGQALANAIPGAKLVQIPGSGHLSNLENPKAFDAALREFLDAHRG